MAELRLARGEVALLDEEDYHKLSNHKWYLAANGYPMYTQYGSKDESGKYTTKAYTLHRLLLDVPTGLVVDHINGDKLDNRRANLRIVTQKVNSRNKHTVRSRSGHIGVYWSSQNKKWNAQIGVDGKSRSFGFFERLEDAVKARKKAEQELWGANV